MGTHEKLAERVHPFLLFVSFPLAPSLTVFSLFLPPYRSTYPHLFCLPSLLCQSISPLLLTYPLLPPFSQSPYLSICPHLFCPHLFSISLPNPCCFPHLASTPILHSPPPLQVSPTPHHPWHSTQLPPLAFIHTTYHPPFALH